MKINRDAGYIESDEGVRIHLQPGFWADPVAVFNAHRPKLGWHSRCICGEQFTTDEEHLRHRLEAVIDAMT